MLDHMAILLLVLEEPPYSFPQRRHHFMFPPAVPKGSNFFASSPALVTFFLTAVVLMGARWYCIVVLTFISLDVSDVEHPFAIAMEKNTIFVFSLLCWGGTGLAPLLLAMCQCF